MSENFNLYSRYYNLLYADKDYKAETDYVSERIKLYSPEAKTILEFGSGTGVHGLQLLKKGYNVYGLEKSSSMVAEAISKGFNCEVADITDFKLKGQRDVVVSLFHVISYINENENLIRCFNNAASHLKDDGIFLFDVWYSPAVYHLKPEPRIKKISDETISVIRNAVPVIDSKKNVVDVVYHIKAKDLITSEEKEFTEHHPMRHFSILEIDLLSKLTGFKIIKVEEFLTGREPSENTWGVCFILKKI
jgi:SAM-dependent methyltransferase